MQLSNPNSSTDASLNALLLPGAAPVANNAGLTAEDRAAFPKFDSFLPDSLPEVASTTTTDRTNVAEQNPSLTSPAGDKPVSISCAVALGRWLVEAEVPSVTAGEGEDNEDSAVARSTCEAGSAKKNEQPAAELLPRLKKSESEKTKTAERAADGLPLESLLLAGYFAVSELPPADLALDETMDSEVREFSDDLGSAKHEELGVEESGLSQEQPQGSRVDGKSDKMGRILGEVSEPDTRGLLRREPKEGAGSKIPAGDFSKRVATESVAVTGGRDVTEPAATSAMAGRRGVEGSSERRQPLPAFENQMPLRPVSDGFEPGAKLDLPLPEAPPFGAAERSVTVPPRVASAEVALAVNGEANIAALPPELGAAGPRRGAWAEFASASERGDADQNGEKSDEPKNFVSSDKEILTRQRPPLGITVAKSTLSMSSRFSSLLPDAPASDRAASAPVLTAGLGEMSEVPFTEHVELAPVSVAHEAVEVVMHATEQLAARDQKSVRLQFSVGDAQLDVRVALHANEVRTQFRTDSAELRQALSHEWQAVAVELGSGDRGLRMAPAVFSSSSNDQSAFNAFAGDTSSRQREHRAAQEANGRSPRAVATVAGGRATADAVLASPRSSRSAPPTSQHLHTVA